MKRHEDSANESAFFSNPKIIENYAMLQEIGVFAFIDSLNQEINNYKNLFAGALDIVNRTTISEIMDATVWQISDHFLPSVIVFLWKPMQNRENITIKSYKSYKLVDVGLRVDSINAFEPFFQEHNEPVTFKHLCSELNNDDCLKPFEPIGPEIVIPILGLSGLYGMMLLGRNILGDEYSQKEMDFLRNLMAFVSKAIQNHLHYEQTLRDLKTGLYNNSFFMDRLSQEIVRARRYQTETSIIIIDVDHFKTFNDTYGHLAGDRVLESLAITIKQGVRGGDIPSRFGGEEFTVLLPDTNREMAWLVAERLRNMVSTMKVTWEPPLPQVTISLGVFTFNKTSNITANEVIRRADEALYISKELGRNRTTVWGKGLLNRVQHLEEKSKQNFSKPKKQKTEA
jgi:diguanylate cyclase (GGDEF)-like protein